MSKYYFKTNINCLGCASQVKPHMDKLEESRKIEHWQVHLQDPEHILEVETNRMSPEEVKQYMHQAGFRAEITQPPAGDFEAGRSKKA